MIMMIMRMMVTDQHCEGNTFQFFRLILLCRFGIVQGGLFVYKGYILVIQCLMPIAVFVIQNNLNSSM
jgi:hypothetical protein